MSWSDALNHHIERCLRRDLGLGSIEPNVVGYYQVTVDDIDVNLAPDNGRDGTPTVRIWTQAVSGLRPLKEIYVEVNELNIGLERLRAVLIGTTVQIAAELELVSVEPGDLGRMVRHVAATASSVGELFATVYGGVPAAERAVAS